MTSGAGTVTLTTTDGTEHVQTMGQRRVAEVWKGSLPPSQLEALLHQLHGLGVLEFDEPGVRAAVKKARARNCPNRFEADGGFQGVEVSLDQVISAGKSVMPVHVSIGWAGAESDAECCPDVSEIVRLDQAFRRLSKITADLAMEQVEP